MSLQTSNSNFPLCGFESNSLIRLYYFTLIPSLTFSWYRNKHSNCIGLPKQTKLGNKKEVKVILLASSSHPPFFFSLSSLPLSLFFFSFCRGSFQEGFPRIVNSIKLLLSFNYISNCFWKSFFSILRFFLSTQSLVIIPFLPSFLLSFLFFLSSSFLSFLSIIFLSIIFLSKSLCHHHRLLSLFSFFPSSSSSSTSYSFPLTFLLRFLSLSFTHGRVGTTCWQFIPLSLFATSEPRN